MPRRDDLEKILILGAGPIVIGQACEFDYSGSQAVKALRDEGYEVVLVNSNPATIMTDPELAHRTYVEPVTPEAVAKVIEKERPDAILPTLGGQTGLNTAVALAEDGTLERFGVEMLGADLATIQKAEDRQLFKEAMERIGLDLPCSGLARTPEEAQAVLGEIGLPCVIRPAFTLGGSGGGIAYNEEEFARIVAHGLDLSMITEVLIEESVIGWKEYELEVMRDKNDNVVIICSIENLDPMGVHTGDSITVAPAQTLTDKEYQRMRDASIAVIREIGVETGGSNIQFAVDPENGRMVVIEMNPRVSRSSALASKATGFPIAKFASKLAVGYTLDEIPNDITKKTPASFEPAIDYCVAKIPRFTFEKFPDADATLTTQMKSVGEAMAIGRTLKEALQKALRSLETGRCGLGLDRKDPFLREGEGIPAEEIREMLATPCADRISAIRWALLAGFSEEEIHELSAIDPWFIGNIREIVDMEGELRKHCRVEDLPTPLLREAKRYGFSDAQLANLYEQDQFHVRADRLGRGVRATFKLVDTCAAEFEAMTPYYYSTYEDECEARVSERERIVILGGGPNRIGQGIEFDYCCCHAAFALRDAGYETVMVNSNPETVSTDYDTSDLLFFEPLTWEDVLNITDVLKPSGVIVQLGGQTPLNLARGLEGAGVPIIGTSPDSIDLAEDRERFQQLLARLGLRQPPNGTAVSLEEAARTAGEIGYPVVVRPSYVLGGRAMEIVYDREDLERYMAGAVDASEERPVLVDKFLEGAIEIDVDAVADGESVVLGGIMEHIEEAGVHSGDSACMSPPYTLSEAIQGEIRRATTALAKSLDVKGLMNVQYALRDEVLYVIEVNPRASRTIPYISKATGVPLAKVGALVMAGRALADLGVSREVLVTHMSVKEPVFPFSRFPGSDIILGPEMRSTGEVMGLDVDFGLAFAKAKMAASQSLPRTGAVFLSVKDPDKVSATHIGRHLADLGFEILCTRGTHRVLADAGIPATPVKKIMEGRPNVIDYLKDGRIALVINTPSGKGSKTDGAMIRRETVLRNVPVITTISGASAAVRGLEAILAGDWGVRALQDY
ncbi:MAG: carbamoyl-phosphate synthase large subunit [Planctomycetota bacterium]|jgi:carbamoyl-phosphate synthase large subunit